MKAMRWFALVISILALLISVSLAETDATFTLPGSLKVIEEKAFFGNTAVNSIVVPDGVQRIESQAFAGSGLTRINLPDSIEFIAYDAFDGCNPLIAACSEASYAYTFCKAAGIPVDLPGYDVHVLYGDDTLAEYITDALQECALELTGKNELNISLHSSGGSIDKQEEIAAVVASGSADLVLIDLEDASGASDIAKRFSGAGIPYLFYNTNPGMDAAEGTYYIGMQAGQAQDNSAIAYATAAIGLNHVYNGVWLDGTDYESADGWSVLLGEEKATFEFNVAILDNGVSDLRYMIAEMLMAYSEEMGLDTTYNMWNANGSASTQLAQAEAAVQADTMPVLALVDLADTSNAMDIADTFVACGVPVLFYNTDPGASVATANSACYVGMQDGYDFSDSAISSAVAEITVFYLIEREWLQSTGYSFEADGYSVLVNGEENGTDDSDALNVYLISNDSEADSDLTNALIENLYAHFAEYGMNATVIDKDGCANIDMQAEWAEIAVVNAADFVLLDVADGSKTSTVTNHLDAAGIPYLLYHTEPNIAAGGCYIGMADGYALDYNAVAQAAARITACYLLGSDWLEDSGYGYGSDGYSVLLTGSETDSGSGDEGGSEDGFDIHLITRDQDQFADLYYAMMENLYVNIESYGITAEVTPQDGGGDIYKQAEYAAVAASEGADLVLLDIADASSTSTVTEILDSSGIPYLMYHTEPNIAAGGCYIGMANGQALDYNAVSEAASSIGICYLLSGTWLDGSGYSYASDGYSVLVS